MPNHTHCILTLAGESNTTLHELIKPYMGPNTEEEYTLDLNKILPMPTDIASTLDTDVRTSDDTPNWYTWRNKNWGTKWNTYLIDLEGRFPDDNEDEFQFYTAWAPPLPCIKKLAELIGVALQLCYLDEGHCYIGRYTAYPAPHDHDECYRDVDAAPKNLRDEFVELCDEDEE